MRYLYYMFRRFYSHRYIVIIVNADPELENVINKYIEKLYTKTNLIKIIHEDNFNPHSFNVIKTLANAKLLIFCKDFENKIYQYISKSIDYYTYKITHVPYNGCDLLLYDRKNNSIIDDYLLQKDENEIFNIKIKKIIDFTRLGAKQNFIDSLLTAIIRNKCFYFLFSFLKSILYGVYCEIAKTPKRLVGIFDRSLAFIIKVIIDYNSKNIDRHKIVMIACHHTYSCNPKYITEELFKRDNRYKIQWIVNKHKYTNIFDYPEQIELTQSRTVASYIALRTAKVIINNSLITHEPYIRNGQYLIQTWHGSLGIKKFDSAWTTKEKEINNTYTSFCISNSNFEDCVYRDSVWPDVPIKRLGHARNDILIRGDYEALRAKVCCVLGIEQNKKICLYAPTFRDSERGQTKKFNLHDLSYYKIDYNNLLAVLHERFGGDWVIVERYHFHLKKMKKFTNNASANVYNASSYSDIQELQAVADVGITDYSSWIFDYILTRRPGFIYATDFDNYKNERDFYYPLEQTPFSIAYNFDTLLENIIHFNQQIYLQNVEDFLEKMGCMDDGFASKRIVDMIESLIS